MSDTRLAVLCGTCLNQDGEVNIVSFVDFDLWLCFGALSWQDGRSASLTAPHGPSQQALCAICNHLVFKYQMLKLLKRVPVLIFKTLKPVAATVTNCRNALGIPCEKLLSSLWISKSRRLERGRNLAG